MVTAPDALRDLRRWAHYDLVRVDGRAKPAKVPTRKVNEPASWMTHDEAVRSVGGHSGLAFLLGDGWSGIDVDGADCDPSLARTIVEACRGAYVETSVSNTGLHVIGRAARLGFEIDVRDVPWKVTPWESSRFFVFTGEGEGDPTVDLSQTIDYFAPRRPSPTATFQGYTWVELTDDDVLYQAAGAENGDKFLALFRGDASSYASRSEADLALCRILAFWTNGDAARVDRLFRQSSLYRAKWEASSYRAATLKKAVGR